LASAVRLTRAGPAQAAGGAGGGGGGYGRGQSLTASVRSKSPASLNLALPSKEEQQVNRMLCVHHVHLYVHTIVL